MSMSDSFSKKRGREEEKRRETWVMCESGHVVQCGGERCTLVACGGLAWAFCEERRREGCLVTDMEGRERRGESTMCVIVCGRRRKEERKHERKIYLSL